MADSEQSVQPAAGVGCGGAVESLVPYSVGVTQAHCFGTDGVVVLPRVLREAQLAEVEAELERYKRDAMPSQRGPWEGHNYTCEVPDDLDTVWRISGVEAEPFFADLGDRQLRNVWDQCFGVRSASTLATQAQFFDKMPGGSKPTPAHQDGGYWLPNVANGCTEMGNVVLLLDDMDHANGGLHYVRGSHADGLRPHVDGVVGFSRKLADWDEADTKRAFPIVGKRGDVIVHHCLTVHYAPCNKSASAHRRTLAWAFHSTNVKFNEAGSSDTVQGKVVDGELIKEQWDCA